MANRDGVAFPLDFQPRPDFQHIGGVESDPEFQAIVDEAKGRVLPKNSDLINVVTSVRPLKPIGKPNELESTPQSVEPPLPMTNTRMSR